MESKLQAKRDLILNGDIYKVLFILGFPVIISNLSQAFYDVVDLYFIGKLEGDGWQAAITSVIPINILVFSIASGNAVASLALISQNIGASNYEEAGKFSGQLISLTLIIGVLEAFFAILFIDNIIDFMGLGGHGDLTEKVKIYLSITLQGIPLVSIAIALTFILQAQGNTLIIMFIALLSTLINVFLDPLLIFTFDLKLAGAAWSTVTAKAFVILIYIYITYIQNRGLKIQLKHINPDIKYMLYILKIGIPAGFNQVLVALSFLIFNGYVIAYYGQNFFEAYGIGNSITSFLYLPAMGISSAISGIIGQNLGANKIDRVYLTLKKGFLIGCIMSLIVSILAIIFTSDIYSIFTRNQEIMSYSHSYFPLVSISAIGFSLQIILMGAFLGSGHTKTAMIISNIRFWLIRLPALFLFDFLGLGGNSVALAMILANYCALVIILLVLKYTNWQTPVIRKGF